MTPKGKYIVAGIAAATVGLATAGALAQRANWHGFRGHMGGGFGHGFRGGGGLGMGLGFGGPYGKICFGDASEFTDVMLVRLEHRVKPTDEQKGAFDEFKAATRTAAEKLREGCPKFSDMRGDRDGDAPKQTAIERLAQTQTGLEASLEAMKTFRPAAEKFYAALSDDQKAKLEPHRGGGRGHWKRDRDHDGKGERGPDSEPDSPTPDDRG
jgi:hypothetical protein